MDEYTCNVLASPRGTWLNLSPVRDYVLKYQANEKLGPPAIRSYSVSKVILSFLVSHY